MRGEKGVVLRGNGEMLTGMPRPPYVKGDYEAVEEDEVDDQV
jgi:hypothetical protein